MEDRPQQAGASDEKNDRVHLLRPAEKQGTTIKVVGVGGAGGNASDNMIENSSARVEFIAVTTIVREMESLPVEFLKRSGG